MRYELRMITPGVPIFQSEIVGRRNDLAAAQACASEHAYNFYHGLAIVDTVAKVIDWGDRWTDYRMREVESPRQEVA